MDGEGGADEIGASADIKCSAKVSARTVSSVSTCYVEAIAVRTLVLIPHTVILKS